MDVLAQVCTAVAAVVLIAVFPFYYAVLSSLETGTALFRPNLLPGAITP